MMQCVGHGKREHGKGTAKEDEIVFSVWPSASLRPFGWVYNWKGHRSRVHTQHQFRIYLLMPLAGQEGKPVDAQTLICKAVVKSNPFVLRSARRFKSGEGAGAPEEAKPPHQLQVPAAGEALRSMKIVSPHGTTSTTTTTTTTNKITGAIAGTTTLDLGVASALQLFSSAATTWISPPVGAGVYPQNGYPPKPHLAPPAPHIMSPTKRLKKSPTGDGGSSSGSTIEAPLNPVFNSVLPHLVAKADPSTDIAPIKADTSTDIAPIKADTATDIAPIKADPSTDIAPIKADTSTDIAPIKADTSTDIAPIKADPSTDIAPITAQLLTAAGVSHWLSTEMADAGQIGEGSQQQEQTNACISINNGSVSNGASNGAASSGHSNYATSSGASNDQPCSAASNDQQCSVASNDQQCSVASNDQHCSV
jgi:hypothetical protein